MTEIKKDRLQTAFYKAIESEAKLIVEEEAKAAAERVEKRVKSMIGQIVVNVFSNVSFEPYGPDQLKITVQFPNKV